MSDRKLRQLPLAIAAMVASMGVQAEYQSPDGNFRMSGFGTLGVVKTDTNDAQFTYAEKSEGATRRPSAHVDSKLAVQGTYKFARTVSATAQVMTQYSPVGEYESSFEWAFLKWQAVPSVGIRVGRMGAPLFMISDFRDVGFANTSVRPPPDVYGQVPFNSVDGGDVSWQESFGPVTLTGQLWGGDTKKSFSTVQLDVSKMRGLNIVAEIEGGFTIRVGRVDAKMTYASGGLTDIRNGALQAQQGLAGFGVPSTYTDPYGEAADFVTVDKVPASFTGIGLGIDRDNWVATFEYTKRKTKSFIVDSTGWYGTVGYRMGAYTPYVGLSKFKVDRVSQNPLTPQLEQTLSGLGVPVSSLGLSDIRDGIDQANFGANYGQKTITLGTRWDAVSNLAVKVQWDRIKTAGGPGLFNDILYGDVNNPVRNGKAVNVFSLALDFVF